METVKSILAKSRFDYDDDAAADGDDDDDDDDDDENETMMECVINKM